MMQFREIPLPSPTLMNKSLLPHRTTTRPPWPGFLTSSSKAALGNFGDATCMEQLLIHCAKAIESNDSTLTQQILWVLNNIASPDGDSNQRLTCGFLKALLSRASKNGNCTLLSSTNASNLVTNTHRFSIIELASFVDLTPWYRFGFTAANAAIVEAIEGYSMIHIVDLSPTHCMQIPTLIDAIASRFEGPPPLLKLTVVSIADVINYPPVLDIGYEDLGSKLVNFARSRNIVMEFRVIPTCCSDGFSSLIEQLHLQQINRAENNNEALVINCHMMLHHIPDESINTSSNLSLRTMFLKSIRSLNPTVVMLIDEDADFTSNNLVSRLIAAFNYFWIPYDTVDSFFQIGSKQRQWYEADICWKIENVIAYEGIQRIERLEPKNRWVQRMKNESFKEISFSEDAFCEVKNMVDEHAAGWGLKKEEDGIVLTWKGHNVVFATVWVPT